MKKNDLVSVVVPVYNVEKYLRRCIDSIILQSYINLEIILVDDGSLDSSGNICDEYLKKDKRIKVIHQKNGGLSAARNTGIKKSIGKYICFIDSDDYVEKDYVKIMYDKIILDDSDIVICNYKRIYENKELLCNADKFHTEYFLTPSAWNKFYKKNLFDDVKYIENKYYEDLGTTPILIMKSSKISYVSDYLYNYVQNNNSIMKKSNDRIFEIYDILNYIKKYAEDNNYYDNYKDRIEIAYIFHILIGTTYRCKNHEKYSLKMVKDIKKHVKDVFPKWYKNKNIKKLNFVYRVFLFFYRINFEFVIYLGLKIFGKFIKEYK